MFFRKVGSLSADYTMMYPGSVSVILPKMEQTMCIIRFPHQDSSNDFERLALVAVARLTGHQDPHPNHIHLHYAVKVYDIQEREISGFPALWLGCDTITRVQTV
jgi:hypothetical protein